MLAKYIDFHTHSKATCSDVIAILSIDYNELSNFCLERSFTLGLHPWYTKRILNEKELNKFIGITNDKNCLGIGEIGLDKYKGENMEVQMAVLRQVLSLSDEINKPVILHCVKSFDKLLFLKKRFPKVKNWAIHGFNRNVKLAEQLLNRGFYLSIGDFNQYQEDLIHFLPSNKYFLETDDTGICIKELYEKVAKLRGISVGQLRTEIYQNYMDFFT